MPRKSFWRRSLSVTAVSSLVLLSITIGASSASAAAPGNAPVAATSAAGAAAPVTDPSAPLPTTKPTAKRIDQKLVGDLRTRFAGSKAVFVQLAGQGAAEVSATALKQGKSRTTARAETEGRRTAARATAGAVVAKAKSVDPTVKVLFQVSNAVPGVAIAATDSALIALAARTDVVKISAIVPKKITNANTAVLTKVLNTWQSVGDTGSGVKVGVIDTGIDYTHADFGGAGTVAAWNTAHANSAAAWTPTAKVVGGYDFVGDDYDATSTDAGYQPVPHPDTNPLDCDSHGTHVSGTLAGYGVNANGSTFTGKYSSLTAQTLLAMKVGPGMAPNAKLYGLKVFGCSGATDAVIPALDWALDPNGDGDFSDHLDIVNLSLGSDYSPADDPENAVIDELSQNGVLPVISAGNGGDLTDIGGSPGNAVTALAAASSVDSYQLRDAIKVNAPAALAGNYFGQVSVAYPWATHPDVTGNVVALSAANADGCDPLSPADTATVAGKVAWLIWDDNDATRRCGSAVRSGNIRAAGGIGAIFTSSVEVFGALITGDPIIPVFQLTKIGSDALTPAVNAGTLNVTFSGSLLVSFKEITPAITDTLSSFSSRGTHGAPGVVKPDVTAPGDTIASAKMGSGNGVLVDSGTSMAAPLTSGIAALVKKKHPTWTPEQIKAAVMNTATHDLYTGVNQTGLKYGPARVGSGRVDALAAVSTTVLAYNLDNAGAVSASFGVVEAPINAPSVTKYQTVRVQNTGAKPVAVNLGYEGVVSQPGVTYSVNPSSATIRAFGSVNVRVKMTVIPSKLRRTIDPTMDANQIDPFLGVARARQFVSDASGHLLIKQLNKANLRVPVYGAAKPAAQTAATSGKTKSGKPAIVVKGAGVNQGTGSAAYQSKLSVMTLGFKSPRQPVCIGVSTTGCVTGPSTKAADIQYVGAGAVPDSKGSKANGWLYFGVSTYGDWPAVGNALVPYVDIDTNGDGVPDFQADVFDEPSTDLLTSYLFQIGADGSSKLVDIEPINFNDGDVDTNVFDTNTILIPVYPAAIGITDATKSFPISYSVATSSGLASPETNNIQDQTPAISFDAAAPRISVAGALYPDRAGVTIPYKITAPASSVSPASTALAAERSRRAKSVEALIFHLDNRSGSKAQVLSLKG